MKALLFCGSHLRHRAFGLAVAEKFEVCGIVSMDREEIVPTPPEGLSSHDTRNFKRHFGDRYDVEKKVFGHAAGDTLFDCAPTLRVGPTELNSTKVADFVRERNADCCVIFGSDLIKSPVFEVLPASKINVHLGLSPWYRGAATLFWPFYNLEPHWAGVTLHIISERADAGPIVATATPPLTMGDGIHDVGARAVQVAATTMLELLRTLNTRGSLKLKQQPVIGRLYLTRHFKPEHLRVIYDLYENRLVDAYLRGEIKGRPPELFADNVKQG
jgi:folate-dependent phosphoribosylglycinamide formyltransferase PurN